MFQQAGRREGGYIIFIQYWSRGGGGALNEFYRYEGGVRDMRCHSLIHSAE